MATQTAFPFQTTGNTPSERDPSAIFASAIDVITAHYIDPAFEALAVASSFGKDSTLVTVLAIEAVRRLQAQGKAGKPLVIMTSNTRIENPLVERLVRDELAKLRSYAAKHSLPLHIVIGKPTLASSWAVKLIGGQGIAPVPGGKAWCTEDWKIRPLRKALREWQCEHGVEGKTLTLTGTRFRESRQRGIHMRQRGESSTQCTTNPQGESILSPIADLSGDEVWELLGLIRSGVLPGAYSDLDGLFEVYAKAGGTSCAVVADDRLSGQQRGECSARTGCMFCTKVTKDESLSNMLRDHPELAQVYAVREWLAAMTFDYDQRNWIGRTIRDGFIRVQPDSYSPAVMRDLLRYCLTADCEEKERAAHIGEEPLFQIVDLEALIAIDFYWSVYGAAPAYEAWRIYRDVVEEGARYYPPTIQRVPRTPLPPPRYIRVGEDWAKGGFDGCEYGYAGLRDPLAEALEADTGAAISLRELVDGRSVLALGAGDGMTVDLDAQESWDFLQFLLDDEIRKADARRVHPSTAARTYLRYGLVKYHDHGLLDAMLQRAAFREACGLSRAADAQALMPKTISEREYRMAKGGGPAMADDLFC